MNKFLIIPFLLLLPACATKKVELIAPEYKIIKAPDDFYKCPVVTSFPKSDTLTDQEVGQLLVKLQRYNRTCKNNIDSLKKFYDDAELTINKDKPKPK